MCSRTVSATCSLAWLAACAGPPAVVPTPAGPLVAPAGDAAAMAAVADEFARRNPGYALTWLSRAEGLSPAAQPRLAFVQGGQARAEVGAEADDAAPGDLIVVRPGCALRANGPLDLLVFTVPLEPPADVPAFVRPDWNPRITDTPGGCATQTGAYRRILLTWQRKNGPYTFAGLNAHRVRIDDSFSHYHPVATGFDEFYLVQMARDGARLLTSDQVARIERPETVTRAEARRLLRSTPLRQGDLVYLPRGLVHRGLGGAVVQVITVPGFVPGAEIGVDHHLRAIGERLGLSPDELPYHEAASLAPVVR